jgi:hypothetical protein
LAPGVNVIRLFFFGNKEARVLVSGSLV